MFYEDFPGRGLNLRNDHEPPDVVIVGAGAAGTLAALFAARAGASVVLVESTSDGGRKILISGGGRCNILPWEAQPDRYVTASSPNSLRKILRSWPLADQIEFFEQELDMKLVLEKDSGKWFPETDRARDVRDRLMTKVQEAGVRTWFDTRFSGLVKPSDASGDWGVQFGKDTTTHTPTVVLATGGLSVPATGSDGKGLSVARELGIGIKPTYPALTPLLQASATHSHLAGLSLEVTIRARESNARFSTTGGFLFTHRGYSGPTVLDASHLTIDDRERGAQLLVQWTPLGRKEWDQALKGSKQTVVAALSRQMPKRLAAQLITEAGLAPNLQLAQLQKADRQKLTTLLCEYPLEWSGNEGYKKAEVTGGGVALSEVNPSTMESRKHPGLYVCGEMLDAFGPIGGHNFMWAWTTGRAAGLGAARSVLRR